MSRPAFRVIVITRRSLALVLFVAAAVVGIWTAYVDVVAVPANAPALPGARRELSPLQPVREVPSAKGMIALTVNVDWGNEVLVEMLDVLDRYGVKATFFLTGRWARLYPELAEEIAVRGHEIGNHGLSHAHPTQLSRAQLAELISGATEVLRQATGVSPVPLFAPPYGEQNRRVVEVAAQHGYYTTLWTLDTIDWQDPPPDTIVQRVVPRARDGAIVLMHPKPQTLEALPRMIEGLRAQGFTLVPLWHMMQGE